MHGNPTYDHEHCVSRTEAVLRTYCDSLKERHVETIQRRLLALEDRMSFTSESESDKDEVYAKNRKLVSLVEKYRCELNEAHLEIRDLKSRLLITSDAQVHRRYTSQ